MASSRKSFVQVLVTFVLGMIVFERGLAHYAVGHFIPARKMEAARALGDSCLIYTGDSRTVAGINPSLLRERLALSGGPSCVADLSLGAVGIVGQRMAVRRRLEAGAVPPAILLGFSADSLLPDDHAPDPSSMIGNQAAQLAWSKASDVVDLYPGFPFSHLDPGVRFLFARSNAVAIYSSLLWVKVQDMQDQLLGNAPKVANRFGRIEDMQRLGQTMTDGAMKRLSEYSAGWRVHPWLELLARDAEAVHARLILVDVPMPARFCAEVSQTEWGRSLRAWLRAWVTERGGNLIDLSCPSWLDDALFSDGLHLTAEGADLFTQDLAKSLGDVTDNRRLR